jgi:adenylate cyclase
MVLSTIAGAVRVFSGKSLSHVACKMSIFPFQRRNIPVVSDKNRLGVQWNHWQTFWTNDIQVRLELSEKTHRKRGFSTVPDLNSSLDGSWYLSPSQHVLEYLGMNAAFPWLFQAYLSKSLQSGTNLEKVLHSKLPFAHVEPLVDKILLAMLVASLGLTVVHKVVRRSAVFLLQPCHVSALALIVLLRMDPTQEKTHIAFNIYLHCMWGAALALLVPDLRDYNAFLEVENFWIEVNTYGD